MNRARIIPETIQTSAMDCGPAALRSLCAGFGVPVSYGRLREACQTEIDGTSIDQIETTAVQLGLDAQQVMLPPDHVTAPAANALPAIAVVRQPNGTTHFIVIWNRFRSYLQVMDPATGRRWLSASALERDLFLHQQAVPRADWLEWSATPEFQNVLHARMHRLGFSDPLPAPDPNATARLDAAVRMVESLAISRVLPRGAPAVALTTKLASSAEPIPDEFWTALPNPNDPSTVLLRGAVLVQARGLLNHRQSEVLPVELSTALEEPIPAPWREIWRALAGTDVLTPAIILAGALSAAATVCEALFFRGLLNISQFLPSPSQRLPALLLILAFSAALTLLDFSLARALLRTGRQLEVVLRMRFLHKLPRLTDRYFSSRPSSDMAQRVHNVHNLRQIPDLCAALVRSLFGSCATLIAILWLYPHAFPGALCVALASLAIPVLTRTVLAERDMRLRTHSGALMMFFLDALLGLNAIFSHGASRIVRREQGTLVREWAHAGLRLQRAVVAAAASQLVASVGLTVWVVWSYLASLHQFSGALLLVYWLVSLSTFGEEAARALWQFPSQRNTVLRLLEPLGAPEESLPAEPPTLPIAPISVALENVTVRAAGQVILDDVSLIVNPGEHVAIVGPSGAGKSTLVGLLLGWHKPASGALLVNGQPLDAPLLSVLRHHTAWLDPQVYLWNRSLSDNLRYGSDGHNLASAIHAAGLESLLHKLPAHAETLLGEAGSLVSGGEGQRVRFGRAASRHQVVLSILDEPGRGLDRSQRHEIIQRARSHWQDATLFCITHDVSDTLDFPRVLVIENARIVEDGPPRALAAQSHSRFAQLLAAEQDVRQGLWENPSWRRLRLQEGRLFEVDRNPEAHAGSAS